MSPVALVTGGAVRAGRAITLALADAGYDMVVNYYSSEEAARSLEVDLTGQGREVLLAHGDVSDASAVERIGQGVRDRFGRLDVLVNSAATFISTPLLEIGSEEWDRVMAVNVRGVWNTCAAVAGIFRERGYGKIVNVSSDTVLSGIPGLLHYVSSKGAIVAMTRSLARELGEANVTVNAIAPGFTETAAALEHGQEAAERSVRGRSLKRAQTPEDVAGTVAFLLSGDSDFVTGQLIVVNGGYVLH